MKKKIAKAKNQRFPQTGKIVTDFLGRYTKKKPFTLSKDLKQDFIFKKVKK
tara:strand:- start:4588 stop:4740 length:153 start_codon:yes stop_codon:yes gene_type:complete